MPIDKSFAISIADYKGGFEILEKPIKDLEKIINDLEAKQKELLQARELLEKNKKELEKDPVMNKEALAKVNEDLRLNKIELDKISQELVKNKDALEKAKNVLLIEKPYIDFVGSLPKNLTLTMIIDAHKNKIEASQTKADAIISKIKNHYSNIKSINIPILPIVRLEKGSFPFLPDNAVGIFPNSINMQIVNGKIYIPNCYYKPFNDKISTLNLNGILVNTLWLWAYGGEVHCGSNLIRKKENIILEIQNK